MRQYRERPVDPYKNMGRVERFLSKLAPKWALRREYNKLKLVGVKRAYEAIETTRLRRTRNDARSADQINNVSVEKLRYQARYLDENHDIARSVLNTLQSNIVGTGLLTFPMVKNRRGDLLEPINEQLAKLWADWSKRPEVTQCVSWQKCQQLAVRSWFRDGELFTQMLRGTVPDLVHGSAVAFSIEQMEADFCPVGYSDVKKRVRQGVRRSLWGRPEAYYFFKDYPTEGAGDSVFLGLSGMSTFLSLDALNEIPAEDVIHLKFTDRIRQTRGTSLFASIFARLDDLKDYEESERVAARIGAAFALAITKNIDYAGSDTPDPDRFRELELAPGIIADNLQPGEEITSLANERPDNKITEFRKNQLKAVAGGANAGYSEISRDFEGSYSSQRQELVTMARAYRALRNEFVSVYVQPIWQNFVAVSYAQGLVDLSGADPLTFFDAKHLGLGTPYIEPQRETEAAIKRVQAGFTSRTQEILERGDDPREVQRTIERERQRDNEAGLIFSSDFATTLAGKSGTSDTTGTAKDDVEEDPADDESADDESADDNGDRSVSSIMDYEIGAVYRGTDGALFEYTVDGFVPYDGDEVLVDD